MKTRLIPRFFLPVVLPLAILACLSSNALAQVPEAMKGVWKGKLSIVYNFVDIKEKQVSAFKIFGGPTFWHPEPNFFEFYVSNFSEMQLISQLGASRLGRFQIPPGATDGSNVELLLPSYYAIPLRGPIVAKSLKFTSDKTTGKMTSLSLKFVDERDTTDNSQLKLGRVFTTVFINMKRVGHEID